MEFANRVDRYIYLNINISEDKTEGLFSRRVAMHIKFYFMSIIKVCISPYDAITTF